MGSEDRRHNEKRRESRHKVLLVEPDDLLRAAYEEVLKLNDFNVISVSGLREVFHRRLDLCQPHLVVVNCCSLAGQIKANPSFASLAVLALGSWRLATEDGMRLVPSHCEPMQLGSMVRAAVAHLTGRDATEEG